jgi:hypothetical protein
MTINEVKNINQQKENKNGTASKTSKSFHSH